MKSFKVNIVIVIITSLLLMGGAVSIKAQDVEFVPLFNEVINATSSFSIADDGKSTLVVRASSSESGSWTLSAVLQKKSGRSWVSVATFSEHYSSSTWIVFSETKYLNSHGTYRFKYTITHSGSTETGYSYTDSY